MNGLHETTVDCAVAAPQLGNRLCCRAGPLDISDFATTTLARADQPGDHANPLAGRGHPNRLAAVAGAAAVLVSSDHARDSERAGVDGNTDSAADPNRSAVTYVEGA